MACGEPYPNSIKVQTGSMYGITTSGTFTIQAQTAIYNLMGESITVDGYQDPSIAQTIALINCIGWNYYEEIQKQGFTFPVEIYDILESRYKIHKRDQKISDIINDTI